MARSAHETMVRNITRAYRQTTPQQRAAGLGWYAEAWRAAQEISPDNPVMAAGVIAALSPRCQWSTNLAWSRAVVEAARTGQECPAVSTLSNRATAWAIANGAAPLAALGTLSKTGRVVSGHKVRSFFLNIIGDVEAVTCDVWATRVALGYDNEKMPGTVSGYAALTRAYRRAAVILGITPREVQAATWTAARGIKPTDAGFHAAAAAAQFALAA